MLLWNRRTPQPKANPDQEKLGLKWRLGHFFPQKVFFRGLGSVLYGEQTTRNLTQPFRKHPNFKYHPWKARSVRNGLWRGPRLLYTIPEKADILYLIYDCSVILLCSYKCTASYTKYNAVRGKSYSYSWLRFFFFFTSTVAGALMLTVHHVDGKMKCVSKMFARRVFIISSLPGITNDGLDCSF